MIFELIAAAALAQSGAQGRWINVWDDEERATYLDSSTVERRGDQRLIWTRTDYRRALDDGTRQTFFYQVIDCRARTFSLLRFINHDANGGVISEDEIPEAQRRVGNTRPNTQAETITNLVCN